MDIYQGVPIRRVDTLPLNSTTRVVVTLSSLRTRRSWLSRMRFNVWLWRDRASDAWLVLTGKAYIDD